MGGGGVTNPVDRIGVPPLPLPPLLPLVVVVVGCELDAVVGVRVARS